MLIETLVLYGFVCIPILYGVRRTPERYLESIGLRILAWGLFWTCLLSQKELANQIQCVRWVYYIHCIDCTSTHLSAFVSSYESIYLCTTYLHYLSAYLFICTSTYLSVQVHCLSMYLPIYPPIYLSIYLSICLAICLSIYLSI